MAKVTTGTFGKTAISNSQSQARKARQAISHASVKPDKLSQHAKCRQAIPACIAKDIV